MLALSIGPKINLCHCCTDKSKLNVLPTLQLQRSKSCFRWCHTTNLHHPHHNLLVYFSVALFLRTLYYHIPIAYWDGYRVSCVSSPPMRVIPGSRMGWKKASCYMHATPSKCYAEWLTYFEHMRWNISRFKIQFFIGITLHRSKFYQRHKNKNNETHTYIKVIHGICDDMARL